MNWKSGAMWAGVGTAIGVGLSYVLKSDQVTQVSTWADAAIQVAAIAGAALTAFLAGLKSTTGTGIHFGER